MSQGGSVRAGARIAVLLCLTCAVWAQDSSSTSTAASSASSVISADSSPAPSLGDVARQTRALHARENARKAQAAADARDWEEPTTFQMCDDAICPSMQLTEDVLAPPAMPSEPSAPKIVPATLQDTSVIAGGSDEPSLAELARQTRQTAHRQAQLDSGMEVKAVPAGFQSFLIQYCLNPQMCSEASVAIPENAEVLSRVNGQHVFKVVLNGEAAMLYAGPADVNAPYRSMTDPDYARMRDLANGNGGSREKADGISTHEMDLEGRHGVMMRFRYQREAKQWWIGERALIETDGAQFLVGCTAPEEIFTAEEAQCTTLINSLRLP